jgi:hypothetical protein
MLSMVSLKSKWLLLVCFVAICILYSCRAGNKKPVDNEVVSLQQDAGVELIALRLWKSIQKNDFETFKNSFVSIKELTASIEQSKVDGEIKDMMLSELQFRYDEISKVILNKIAFEKFRDRIQRKFGKDFWKQVQVLEDPIVTNHEDSLKNTTEAEVSYKIMYNSDTNYVHFNNFYFQKEGWRFLGDIRFSKNQSDENIYDFKVNDFANPNQDTSKGIQKFEDAFEKEEAIDE